MSRIKKQILNKLKEYANKMGRDHLGGDDYTSKKKGGLRDFDGYDNVDYNKDMPMDEGFKSEYKGNDGIIWKKGKTRGGVTNFTPYYKGHNIDFGGHNFKTEKELKDFIKDYILSNQLYRKYRNESVNEKADYKYLTQVILDAKPKYDVYYNSSHNVVNIGGVGYDKGDLVKNFNQKPGSSSKIKNNFYHAHQDPQKTKREVEKLSKGKIKVKVGDRGFLSYSVNESVNKSIITEKQLKGLDGIDSKTPLTKISDTQKLNIIQGTGNNISFKVPKGFNRNFWQVFSKGKIKKKKSLKGEIVYYLPGKFIDSPSFKSVKDLINGVDWESVEQTRRFNESVNEGMFSTIDQIRQDSKNVRDFVKKVFADRDFKDMKNDKEFLKYLKSIYEGVDESKGVPQNYMQGRTSDYHTALRGKKKDYSGGTNFKKTNHGQPDVDEEEDDQTNPLNNKQIALKAESFDKVEHLKLLNLALRAIPGSQKQKEIIRKLNQVRKAGGMRPLKEQSIVEYGQRLDLSFIEDEEARLKGTPKSKDAINRDIDETAKRDYKDEYKKFQSSTKSKKYRAELNKYNRQKGTYGNGDGKDASHKGGKIVGFESASKNRGRREKSRLKKK